MTNPRVVAAGVILALLGSCVLLFPGVLFGGEAFFSRDIAPFFYPMKAFLAESVRGGDLPLWNPWVLNGEPFFATLQPGALYPGSLLLYLLPLPFAFSLLLVLHFPLAGLGVWVLLRRWGHGALPSLVGALGFTLGGYFVSLGNFPNNLQTVAWLPWVAVAWDRWLAGGGRREAVVFAAACAVAFLGGEPQMLAIGLLLVLLHGLVDVEVRRVPPFRQLAVWAGAGVLAMGLAAVQLLPFVEYVGESVRTLEIGLEYAARRSLEPAALLHLLVPPALNAGVHGFTTRYLSTAGVPWLLSVYPGVLVLLLGAVGVSAPPSRRWLLFWSATGATGLILALGPHTPLYPALFRWVPLVRPFRYPEKFFFLTAFALVVLAARGMEVWRAGRGDRYMLVAGLPVLALLAAVTGTLLGGAGPVRAACAGPLQGALLCADPPATATLYLPRASGAMALVAAVLLLAVLAARGRIGRSTAAGSAALLLAFDLALAARAVNPSVDASVYETRPWTSRVMSERGGDPQGYRFRGSSLSAAMGSIVTVRGAWELSNMYLDFQTLGPNVGMLFGHLAQDGLQGVELASVALTQEAVLHGWTPEPVRLLRMAAVRYYADATRYADTLRGLRLVATAPDLPIRLFEIPDPLPRAYLVTEWERAPSQAAALARALHPELPLHLRVVLEEEPPLALPAEGPAAGTELPPPGHVVGERYEADVLALRARAERPALLVLTDRYYPGWEVEVDGAPARVLRANGIFRAVAVPAGESRVTFRFQPGSLRVGAWISAAALLVAGGVLLRPAGRRGAG